MKQLTKDELVRSTYNTKLVAIFTVLAIAGVLVYGYFEFLFGLVIMILALANLTKTIEAPYKIDHDNFFIVEQEVLSLQDNVIHFDVDSLVLPKFDDFKIGDKVFIIFVNMIPIALFRESDYELDTELKSKELTGKEKKKFISFYKNKESL